MFHPSAVKNASSDATKAMGDDIIAGSDVLVAPSRKRKKGKKKAQQVIRMDLKFFPPSKYTQNKRVNGCVFLSLASTLAYAGDHCLA